MSVIEAHPQDGEGNYLDVISAFVEETIPTAPYANTKISFHIKRVVKDGDTKDALASLYDEAEETLDLKRQVIIDALDGSE